MSIGICNMLMKECLNRLYFTFTQMSTYLLLYIPCSELFSLSKFAHGNYYPIWTEKILEIECFASNLFGGISIGFL